MNNEMVIIRVWTSKENKIYPGKSVGHVSIETPNEYMSLFPVPFTNEQITKYRENNKLQKKYQKYFMLRDAEYHQTFEEDFKVEGDTQPQVVICLHSLDFIAIERKFQQLITETTSWRLIGSNLFVQKLEGIAENLAMHSAVFESDVGRRGVDNCASLALKLLKAGGIMELVDFPEKSSFESKTSSSVKPDQILEILIPAKNAEAKLDAFKNYPLKTGETNVIIKSAQKTLDDEKQSTCLTM